MPEQSSLAPRLLAWYERHGRKDLPWQIDPTPYRVWVSEIMLQQTQVTTVLGYYARFMERFPDVVALAGAPVDDVLHLWSGLGYYARGRNLHRAAQRIRDEHQGVFPDTVDGLTSLPGIGRSTAGAILALSAGARLPILDGNVKRVLTRFHGIDEWPGRSAIEKRLWTLAEAHLPTTRLRAYTQGIMDLGATVCVRSRPVCAACPLESDCVARREHRQAEIPARKPRVDLPTRETVFVVVRDAQGAVLLERRPPAGIWGGLWSFPECGRDADLGQWCVRNLGSTAAEVRWLEPIRHGFSHYRLNIHPAVVTLGSRPTGGAGQIMEGPERVWYNGASPLGLAAPVSRLLEDLARLEI